MSIVIPTILTASREELAEKIQVLPGLTEVVQIDVVDGRFASPPSWPYSVPDDLSARTLPFPRVDGIRYEVDLMVEHPERVAGRYIEIGFERITIHVESARNLSAFIDDLRRRYGHAPQFAPGLLSLGLSIGVATDNAVLLPYLDSIDYVQFMGVATIGTQGKYPLDERVFNKIAAFRKRYPRIPVQVDGGVNLTHAPRLLSVGVNQLVIGSALWKAPDLSAEIAKYDQLIEEYGRYW